jgi:hypothetical protein
MQLIPTATDAIELFFCSLGQFTHFLCFIYKEILSVTKMGMGVRGGEGGEGGVGGDSVYINLSI